MTPIDDALRGLLGRPYAYGATGPRAFDCWGLVVALRQRLDLPAPPAWNARELATLAAREAALARCEVREVAPADGAVAVSERGAHAGVVLAGRVVHAVCGAGVVSWSLARWCEAFPDSRFYEWQRESSCC